MPAGPLRVRRFAARLPVGRVSGIGVLQKCSLITLNDLVGNSVIHEVLPKAARHCSAMLRNGFVSAISLVPFLLHFPKWGGRAARLALFDLRQPGRAGGGGGDWHYSES